MVRETHLLMIAHGERILIETVNSFKKKIQQFRKLCLDFEYS